MINNQEQPRQFIFYLFLEDSLPKSFYIFDKYFKELDFILIPVKIDQLQRLVASSNQEQVIVIASVIDVREYKIYNEKVRKYLKNILKSKRLTFMHISSFSKLNDQNVFAIQKNYYFMKYPINARILCTKIREYYSLKKEQLTVWPGGRRSSLNLGAA